MIPKTILNLGLRKKNLNEGRIREGKEVIEKGRKEGKNSRRTELRKTKIRGNSRKEWIGGEI